MPEVKKVIPGDEHHEIGVKISAHRLNAAGQEIVDGRPMAPPVGFQPEESVFDRMRQMMRAASLEAAQAGEETLEEANDFYIEDDPQSRLPPSEYEFDEDHQAELEQYIRQLQARQEARYASPRSRPA